MQNLRNCAGEFLRLASVKNDWLFIMRTGTFILMVLFCTSNLLLARSVKGQEVESRPVTITLKKLPIYQVLERIEAKTGISIMFESTRAIFKDSISVSVTNMKLGDLLNKVLKDKSVKRSSRKNVILIEDASDLLNPGVDLRFTPTLSSALEFEYIKIHGTIVGSKNQPLSGATIRVKGTNITTMSDESGRFELDAEPGSVLQVSYVGYKLREYKLSKSVVIIIDLQPADNQLDTTEIKLVSTGYQTLPKERATGSFEVITAKQLRHSTSPNLLQRLEGISSSIVFNNSNSPNNSAAHINSVNPATGFGISPQTYSGGYTLDNMTIRGKNTLSVNNSGNPLIVIDGIANPYDISLVNPDDVVSITILKDAAAASIWGSRAANGVLVITTKRGEFNRSTVVSFNSNINVSEKPDLDYLKTMTTSEYIDAEIYGFQAGNKSLYPIQIGSGNGYTGKLVSPIYELLDLIRLNAGNDALVKQYTAEIDAFRQNDIRRDQVKYLLQNAVNQNYNLSISGGAKSIAYALSGGYQHTRNNTVHSSSERMNLNYSMQMKWVKNLDLSTAFSFSAASKKGLGPLSLSLPFAGLSNLAPYYYPYSKLAGDNGEALAVPIYRPGFIQALNDEYGNKIQDYTYRPLEEFNESYTKSSDQNANFSLTVGYTLLPGLSAQVIYNANLGFNKNEDYYSDRSIYVRDLVNRYTDPVSFENYIPLGGFYNPNRGRSFSHTLRGMLNHSKTWNNLHELNAILGAEVFNSKTTADPIRWFFGYDPNTKRFTNVNHDVYYNTLFDWNSSIPNTPGRAFLNYRSRTLSEFFNAAYTYDRRYTLSASVRKDGSSAFAGLTNKTGTPFYSMGASWQINNESFYKASWLPSLKVRATFGYNGNANPNATSYPPISMANSVDYRTLFPYANVNSLSNFSLRPERTAVTNIGIDYAFKNNRLSGSIEYYKKITKDLLAFAPLDPSLGFNGQVYNVGNIKASGVDFQFRSVNITQGKFSWESNFIFSFNDVTVTKNYTSPNASGYTLVSNPGNYLVGNRLSSVYAYQWGGLNPANGAARAVIGQNMYDEIGYTVPASAVRNMGSSVPRYFGSVSNTINYAGFSLWVNVNYKLGYFNRRPASMLFLNNTQMNAYMPQQVAGAEYSSRWQKAGDELFTNVPSMDLNRGFGNDGLYQYADINVYKADNIRLQEINLSYSFTKRTKFIKNPRIYLTAPVNLILWKANNLGLDPDVYDYPVSRAYGLGFSANF